MQPNEIIQQHFEEKKHEFIFVFDFSPPAEESFDPSTYVIGPEEDLPRKLEYFTFVMHAPDDYFYYRKAPYPTVALQTDQEFVVTRQGPRVRMIKAGRPVYHENVPPLIPMNVQNC